MHVPIRLSFLIALVVVAPAAAQVVLNEVLPAPGTDWTSNGSYASAEDEWIELLNTGASPAPVEGWFVSDATGTPRFGLSGSLAAGEFLFVTGEHAVDWEGLNGFPALGLSLNNSGDTVRLFQVGGGVTTLVDSVAYSGLGPDVSSGRMPDGAAVWEPFDALDGGSGPQPTPGGPNGGLASPKILSSVVEPSFVTSADTLRVRAVAGDTDGIVSALVRLRVDGGPVVEHAMALVEGVAELGTWEWALAPQPAGTGIGVVVRVSDGTLVEETNEVLLVVLGADSPVVLNEVLADPAADAAGDANGDGTRDGADDEFVELLNRSGAPVDLSGWTLADGSSLRHEFPAGLVLGPGQYHVVFGGGAPAGIPSSFEVASTGGLSLNNSGEEVSLVGPDTLARDLHSWGSEGNTDQSMIRVPDGTGSWTRPSEEGMSAPFSPGAPNVIATSVASESWAAIKTLYRD